MRRNEKLKRTAICPKCFRSMPLERHHIFPVRFFGRIGNGLHALYLCNDCHVAIEKIIPQHTKLSKTAYLDLTFRWLRDRPPSVFLE